MINEDGWWLPKQYKHKYHTSDMPKVLKGCLDNVRDFSVAVDGGAFVGVWTKKLAEVFERVVAIEIADDNFECLRENTAAYNNVECIHACLGNGGGPVGYVGDQDPESPIRRVCGEGTVPQITIDSLGLKSCGLIKLDLQGYDLFALWGAENTITQHRPLVCFEHVPKSYTRYGVESSEPFEFMYSNKMKLLTTLRKNLLFIPEEWEE